MLVNDDNSLKVNIPINSPTIVKTNDSGEHINTTTNPIIINTKEPNTVSTILERFENGYTIIPVVNNDKLPPINIPVHTKYM